MRLSQSISGHSSGRSTANHISRPTVSQLQCVSDIISNWFEKHQPQNKKISTVTNAPCIQNSNQMTSRLTASTSFPRVFSQLLQYLTQGPSFSTHRAAPMTKTHLIFPAFSSRFVDFAVQFCFRCKFSFNEEQRSSLAQVRFDSGAIFLDQSQYFATYSNQWNCFILFKS